jgi:hypothetical protein
MSPQMFYLLYIYLILSSLNIQDGGLFCIFNFVSDEAMIPTYFHTMLGYSDININVMERLLSLRFEMSRQSRKDIVEVADI